MGGPFSTGHDGKYEGTAFGSCNVLFLHDASSDVDPLVCDLGTLCSLGWIMTVLMTFFGLYALVILLKWKSITPKYIPLIGRFQKNRTLWYIIGVIWGVVFLLMGIFLY